MIKLICFEITKLLHRKTVWLIVLGLILANGIAVHYRIVSTDEYDFSLKKEAELYSELERKSIPEKLMWFDEEERRIYEEVSIGNYDYATRWNSRVRDAVHQQVQAVSSYDNYLKSIDEQAERMLKSLFFSDPGTFHYKNTMATREAYANLKGTHVSAEFSGGVLLITNNRLTDAFMLLSLFILSMHLFISEREEGTLPLIKSRRNGYVETMTAKLASLFLLAAVVVFAFYATNLAVSSHELGLGDVHRPVQSLEGFLESPFAMSVRTCLVLFFAAKFISVFAVLCVFFLICIACRNTLLSCTAAILVFGIEAILAANIDIHSYLSLLKQFNLVALLDTGSYFSNYINANVFEYPVNAAAIGIITASAAAAAGSAIGLAVYVNEKTTDARQSMLKGRIEGRIIFFGGKHFHLFAHEIHKLFVMNKGLYVLAAFLAIQTMYFNSINYFIYEEEMHYINYANILSGELTEEKEAFLQSEQDGFDNAEREIALVFSRHENGEIDERYADYLVKQLAFSEAQKNALARTQQQYSKLAGMRNSGSAVEYVCQSGWEKIYGQEGRTSAAVEYMSMLAALTLILSYSEAVDATTHMNMLISVTKKGRRAVILRKIILCFLLAAICMTASFLPRILSVCAKYGLDGLSAPAKSIMTIPQVPDMLTAGSFFILHQVGRLLLAWAAGALILFISCKTKNGITTILIAAAIFILPLAALLLI